MSDKGRKLEPPLHLEMDFGEAFERFAKVKPKEVAESIERSKKKRPPGAETLDGQATPDGLQRTKRKR